MAEGETQATVLPSFPLPPPFYKLYAEDGAGPLPPPPPCGQFLLFGFPFNPVGLKLMLISFHGLPMTPCDHASSSSPFVTLAFFLVKG